MASKNRIAGLLSLILNGETHNIAGDWTYNFGVPKNEAMVGPDRTHGYKSEPQVAYIQGKVRDRRDLDVVKLLKSDDITAVLQLANGKSFVGRSGWVATEGEIAANSAEIDFRIEFLSADEA